MEGDHFSLCWNNFHTNLSSGFHSLLKDGDLVDVTLAAEGKFIKAHKTILSVCSPFFKELFRVNPCKHPIVILPDVNYEALRSLMQFMYQGEVSVSQEEIATFMRVAEVLKVKGLTETDNNSGDAANGFTSTANRSSLGLTEQQKQNLLKRPRYVKKFTRPLNPWRPIEMGGGSSSYKLPKSPPPQSTQSTPQSQSQTQSQSSQPRHPSPVPSPGLKKPRLETETPPPELKSPPPATCTSQSLSARSVSPNGGGSVGGREVTANQDNKDKESITEPSPSTTPLLIKPKDEPIDHSEEETASQCGMDEMNIDIANMLDTTLGDSPMQFPGWPSPEMARAMMQQQDSSSPGTIQCVLGRRGNPRLIVDGYVFYKKSVYKGKAFWYCKNGRGPEKCQAVCWTMNGNIVKWPYMHSHPVIPDIFNPEEDTEVPIENLQEVLWQTSLS